MVPSSERISPKTTERTFLSTRTTNCSTPWERSPKVIPVYLLTVRSAIRHPLSFIARLKGEHVKVGGPTSPEGQPSRAGGMKRLEDFIPYTSDIVCGPLPPLRGPGLQSREVQLYEPTPHTLSSRNQPAIHTEKKAQFLCSSDPRYRTLGSRCFPEERKEKAAEASSPCRGCHLIAPRR